MRNSIPGLIEKRQKEISDKLYHNIFFNKKFREGVKKDFGEILDRGLKLLETLPNPQTLKEAEDKLLGERMIDVGELYLKTVKKAEKMQPGINQYGKFVLYRKGRICVYQMDMLRNGKIKHGYLVFPNCLPLKKMEKAYREFGKFDSTEYKKEDWGKTHLKQSDFSSGYYHFWGKYNKSYYNIKMTKWTKRRMYFEAIRVV